MFKMCRNESFVYRIKDLGLFSTYKRLRVERFNEIVYDNLRHLESPLVFQKYYLFDRIYYSGEAGVFRNGLTS